MKVFAPTPAERIIMQTLFETKSKKEQVYEFIKSKGRCRTSEIISFGTSIFYNRADRSARDLASEGRIWRVSDTVKNIIAPNSKEDIWSTHEADKGFKKIENNCRQGMCVVVKLGNNKIGRRNKC